MGFDCQVADDIAAGNGGQHGIRDDDSGARLCAGYFTGGFDHGFGDCISDCGAGAAGGGFFSVSYTAAFADAVSVVVEHGFQPDESCCMAMRGRMLPAQ